MPAALMLPKHPDPLPESTCRLPFGYRLCGLMPAASRRQAVCHAAGLRSSCRAYPSALRPAAQAALSWLS